MAEPLTPADALERAIAQPRHDLERLSRRELRDYAIKLEMLLNDAYVDSYLFANKGPALSERAAPNGGSCDHGYEFGGTGCPTCEAVE